MSGVVQLIVGFALCWLVLNVNAASRVKRDGAHHHGHGHGHGHNGGSFGFHGFGPHYNQPLIIEEAGRFINSDSGGHSSSSYGYKPPSQSYGPPPGPRPDVHGHDDHHGIGGGRDQHGVGHHGIPDFVGGGGVCPVGCVPAGDFRGQQIPSTYYGPPLPIYADFGSHYPQNAVDEDDEPDPPRVIEEPSTKPKPTPRPKPSKTTPAPPEEVEEATLPPSITEDTQDLARTFGFEIVVGDGTPPSQDELDEVLELLPPGLSFSLLPMDIQDSFFDGQIKLKKLGDKEKRHAQNKLALAARRAAARSETESET